ncbi:hypothetical protein BKA70DRAFT_1568079 [Coprinopsis sp. MPI-PUGE-AT-0042]|nr:hypothetical protein BKA70DRAFT_1568079 [Coprinopsis sp. MPI-PUGE-AT-0042]
MATVTLQRTRSRTRAAASGAGSATQGTDENGAGSSDPLGETPSAPAVSRSYADVAATPPSRPSTPLSEPTSTASVAVDEPAPPYRREPQQQEVFETPRAVIETTRPLQAGRSSPMMMPPPPRRLPGDWDVVQPRRRTRSLESANDGRAVRFEVRNRSMCCPLLPTPRDTVPVPADDAVAQAERNLTSDQRAAIGRRYEISIGLFVRGLTLATGATSGLMNKRMILGFSKLFWTAFGSMKITEPLLTLVVTPRAAPSNVSRRSANNFRAQPIEQIEPESMLGRLRELEAHDSRWRPPGRGPPGDPYGDGDQFGDDHWEHPRRPNRRYVPHPDDGYYDDYYPVRRHKPIIAPTPPKPYDGSEDLNKYTTFRDGGVVDIRMGRVPPEDQVEVLAPYLEGKAHRWYLSRVAANPSAWTLTEFMDGVFNNSFSKDFKARLHRLSPETSSWDDIFDGAEAAEHALKVLKRKGNDSHPRSDNPTRNQSGSQSANRASGSSNGRHHNDSSRSQNTSSNAAGASNRPGNSQGGSQNLQSKPYSQMTDEQKAAQRDDRLRRGECFRCGDRGHLYRNCPRGNTMRSNNSNRPPGMSAFNLEMGYVDDLTDEVLDSLPSMAIDFDNADSDAESTDACHHPPGRVPETIRHEIHEPEWMQFHDCPKARPRPYIGDSLAMMGKYVLNESQPYPGDNFFVCRDKGINVPRYRLEHPNFRLGRYYARVRLAELNRPHLEGEYSMQMGDAYSTVAGFLLRDGVRRHYPNQFQETEVEDRFNVQVWHRTTESVTYVVNDYDRGTYTLLPGKLLQNPLFNLVKWYSFVVRGQRNYETYPLPGWVSPAEIAARPRRNAPLPEDDDDETDDGDHNDTETNSDGDEPPDLQPGSDSSDSSDHSEDGPGGAGATGEPGADAPDDDDEMPALQSCSNTNVSESSEAGESNAPDEEDDDLTDPEDWAPPPELWQRSIALTGQSVRDRFEVLSDDYETYQVFDHHRSEVTPIAVEQLRNPSFNIGLWYAEICGSRSEMFDLEEALVRWQIGRQPEWTTLGRRFERRIEALLSLVSRLLATWVPLPSK